MARTQTSRLRNRHPDRTAERAAGNRNGFTLLELLLVLTILGLALAVAAPLVGSGGSGVGLKRGALELASALRQTRQEAVAAAGERVLLLDLDNNSYASESGSLRRRFPDDSTVTVEAAESERRDDLLLGIRFFPNGASTGGSIRISQADRSLEIGIDWLTGRVTIHDPE